MKPKNFPMRKLLRQLKAKGKDLDSLESQRQLKDARDVRTKKYRGG